MVACTGVLESNTDQTPIVTELTFQAKVENSSSATKTELQSDGEVWWQPGDAVSLFLGRGENGGSKFIAQNTTVTKYAEFKGTIESFAGSPENSGGEFWFWSVYPYSEKNSCDGESITLEFPHIQYAKKGTFGEACFPTIARAKGLELSYYNICGGIKLTISRNDIISVSFRSNNGELLCGTARVMFPVGGYPTIDAITDGMDDIILKAPIGEVFESGEDYFMIIPPIELSEGFTLTFRTAAGKEGAYVYNKSRKITRSKFGRLPNIDETIVEWKDVEIPSTEEPDIDDSGDENSQSGNGVYLGIIGFNSDLYPFTFRRLTPKTVSECYTFIDGLSNAPRQTLLCWTIEQALPQFSTTEFPENLFNASVVTFTDGFDDGSPGQKRRVDGVSYTSEEYYESIHSLLSSSSVSGIPVSAYAIGLSGKDAATQSPSGMQYFNDKLSDLTSPTGQVFKATNMTEVNSAFSKIADEISKTINLTHIDIKTSEPARDESIRFTFDLKMTQSDANSSKLYIEGRFNPSNMCLENIVYQGMNCPYTTIQAKDVLGEEGEQMILFSFDDISVSDNSLFDDTFYRRWQYIPNYNYWNPRSETYSGSGASIRRNFKSAAVMLLIDCSYSLGDDFAELKSDAQSFISKLYEASIDELAVASVKLSQNNLSITIGESHQLDATINPSTAADKSITWSSNNSEVATVDNNGKVTAISEGRAIITVTTIDGGKTASCIVTVKPRMVSSISLDATQVTVEMEKTIQLSATILPSDATYKVVEWASSNDKIATINSQGLISGIQPGTVTITATSIDGSNISASCVVIITPHYAQSLSIDKDKACIVSGDSLQLNAIVLPENTTNKSVEWKSSDNDVADVNSYGIVCAKKPGNAIITVTCTDGTGHYASCRVTVSPRLAESVLLDASQITIRAGDTYQISATIHPNNTTNKQVEWLSSDNTIATISPNGVISGVQPGTAIIQATCIDGSDCSASCEVKVVPRLADSISIDVSQATLIAGKTLQLSVVIMPACTTDKSVVWSSSQEDVAIVSPNGLVTGLQPGTTIITASSVDGSEISALCQVNVIPCLVESVTLNNTTATVEMENSLQLTATVLPTNATNKSVVWSSSNIDIATVRDDGLVSCLIPGSVNITATTVDGSNLATSCKVTVTPHYVQSISLDRTTTSLVVGDMVQLAVSILPANATDKTVIWNSSNTSVATVNSMGLVTGLQTGTATITATSADGSSCTAACAVTVTPRLADSITLAPTEVTLVAGDKQQLGATVLPANTTNKSVIWSSSNASVAIVSSNGLVTAVQPGIATITGSCADGSGYSATCAVTVTPRLVESISLSTSELMLEIGKTWGLSATVLPSNATNKTVEWSSSDESVATVNSEGRVSGVMPGSAIITASCTDGSCNSATCIVTITPSCTSSHLSLVLVREDSSKRYYVTHDQYLTFDLTGYSKIGVNVSPSGLSTHFIIKLQNANSTQKMPSVGGGGTWTSSEVVEVFTLPNSSAATWLSNNWNTINSVLLSFGGTSLSSYTYWSSYYESYRGTKHYFYFGEGTGLKMDNDCSTKCHVREVIY